MTATWQGSCATSRRSWIGSLHLPREFLPVNIPFSFHMATWARSRRNVYFGLVYKFTPSLSPSREALLRPLVPLFVPFWGGRALVSVVSFGLTTACPAFWVSLYKATAIRLSFSLCILKRLISQARPAGVCSVGSVH